MTRILLYGGSFNPPHVGHVLTAFHATMLEVPDFTLIIPTFKHPYGKDLADYEDRVRMCELAFAAVPGAEVSRIEQEIGGVSWTLKTVREVAARYSGADLTMIMGSDVYQDYRNWEDYSELQKLLTILPIGRMSLPVWNDPNPIVPDISSSRIREIIEKTGSMDGVVHLIYPKVIAYIEGNGLYGYKR